MRSSRRSGGDTISSLPCNVQDVILGCLPLKDAVKTSILSRNWRYKWVTRQQLKFDDSFFRSFKHVQGANGIIYQVLLLHKGPILNFHLESSILKSCPDIDHWILFISKENVQEFTLCLYLEDSYNLPSHFFTFQQLRYLELAGCLFHPPPDFKGFEKLISLDFHRVTLVPALFRNLMSSCPLLERLRLHYCIGFDSIEIDAANLKCFEFRGPSKSISFKNAPLLAKVIVHLDSRVSTDAPPICSNFSTFFGYMPSLQGLKLVGYAFEYLTIRGVPESPLTALNNVKSLVISRMSFSKFDEVSGVVYMITSCPNLGKLTIECETGDSVVEPVVQFLRAQCGIMRSLQRVVMLMFSGMEMEMEFVRFILASAPLLEEILMWNYEPLTPVPRIKNSGYGKTIPPSIVQC